MANNTHASYKQHDIRSPLHDLLRVYSEKLDPEGPNDSLILVDPETGEIGYSDFLTSATLHTGQTAIELSERPN